MNLYERTCDVFTSLKVEFLIIGGFAVNFWGYNRSTGDLDFFVHSSESNIIKLFAALDQLGFSIDDEAQTAIRDGELIQFTDNHHVIELLFKINLDTSFPELLSRSKYSRFGQFKVPFMDFEDLIDEKLKSHREKDLHDVYELKRIRKLL